MGPIELCLKSMCSANDNITIVKLMECVFNIRAVSCTLDDVLDENYIV